jgi:hypothetical protein
LKAVHHILDSSGETKRGHVWVVQGEVCVVQDQVGAKFESGS